MGLMEAMRYPGDYDGIIAGAPYMDNRTQLWGYKNAKAFLKAHVAADVVAKVNEAVLAQCDAEDGVQGRADPESGQVQLRSAIARAGDADAGAG